MGTTIEIHVEQQVNGSWHEIESDDFNDTYNMFALLCGVRDYYKCKPIVAWRELPNNLSASVEEDYVRDIDGMASFSPHYITKADLETYKEWDTPFFDTRSNKYVTPNDVVKKDVLYKKLFDQIRAASDHSPIRMIFWFS